MQISLLLFILHLRLEGPATPWRIENTSTGSPVWSAFRESSFGVGGLEVLNDTHAFFSWNRHACASKSQDTDHMNFSSSCVTPGDNSKNAMDTSDSVWIVRPDEGECGNRYFSTDYEVPVYDVSSVSSDDDDDEERDILVLTLEILCSVFGGFICILLYVVYSLWSQLNAKSTKRLMVVEESNKSARDNI